MSRQVPSIRYYEDSPVRTGLIANTGTGGISSVFKIPGWKREALLQSEPHWRLPNGAWSGGGNFYVRKSETRHTEALYTFRSSPGVTQTYRVLGLGNHPSVPGTNGAPSADRTPLQNFSELYGSWTTGFARTRPGNPVAGVAQFLIELRDLPSIPRLAKVGVVPIQQVPRLLWNHLKDFKSLGSEYLNVVFGWQPFVSDLREFYQLYVDIDKRLAKLVQQNGHGIRRRAVIDESTTSTRTVNTYGYYFAGCHGAPPFRTATSVVTSTSRETVKTWFAGKYTYYVPDIGSSQWTRRARRVLFGVNPTPEAIWNVLPWSWLFDWFGNVGDVMSNMSPNAVDNLVTHYGFVMRHRVEEKFDICQTDYSGFSNAFADYPPVSATVRSTSKDESKKRVGGGNPFGLGFEPTALTSRQLAILAALGISRETVKS